MSEILASGSLLLPLSAVCGGAERCHGASYSCLILWRHQWSMVKFTDTQTKANYISSVVLESAVHWVGFHSIGN